MAGQVVEALIKLRATTIWRGRRRAAAPYFLYRTERTMRALTAWII